MQSLNERFRPLFYPESVAVIGASMSPQKWGFGITHNIINGGYRGALYPINLKEKEIMGRKAYPSLLDVPGPVDLAMIVVPPPAVMGAIKDCQKKKVGAAVIITAGFGEVGPAEKEMELAIVEQIRKTPDFVVIGPNCQGIVSTPKRLFAQIISLQPDHGHMSIVSQSGNVGGSMLHWGTANNIGYSKFVSSGNEAVTTVEDLIEYYGEDPDTRVILAYIEGVKNGRRFIEVCKKVTPKKPIVVLKGGQTEAGGRAAASHTGSMAGSNEIFEALCRQVGITITHDVSELFYTGATFLNQPLPRGNKVAIVTIGGGWGVLTADAVVKMGLEVTKLRSKTIEKLNEFLAARWSHGNPVDLAASEGDEIVKRALEVVIADPNVDAVIQLGLGFGGRAHEMKKRPSFLFAEKEKEKILDAIIARMLKNDMAIAQAALYLSEKYRKPVISSSDSVVGKAVPGNLTLEFLAENERVVQQTPLQAACVLAHLVRYAKFLDSLNS